MLKLFRPLSAEVRATMDRVVNDNARLLAGIFFIVYGFYALSDFFTSPQSTNIALSLISLGTTVIFGVSYLVLKRWGRPGFGHFSLFMLLMAALGNSVAHLFFTGDPLQTTTFMLIVIASGLFILSHSWFIASVLAIVISWQLTFTDVNGPAYEHFSVALFASLILSALVHLIRTQSYISLEESRSTVEAQQTELTAALSESQVQKKLYNRLTETLYEGVITYEHQHILEANPRAAEVFGFGVGEMVGMALTDLVAPFAREATSRVLAARTESPYSVRGLRKSGELFPMELSIREVDEGDHQVRVAIVRDLTESIRRREEHERFFRLSNDMLIVANMDGYFEQVNPIMSHILGYSEQELTARPFVEFFVEEDRPQTLQQLENLKRGIPLTAFQNRMVTKDGQVRQILWDASPVVELGQIYATGRDVTEIMDRQMAERLAAKRLQSEVELAAEIQSTLLPKVMPQLPGFRLAAFNQPARYISGDLYDALPMNDGGLQVALADIAGKGMSAGMLTVTTRTLLRASGVTEIPLTQFLNRVEDQLYEELTQLGLLITLFVGRLHPYEPVFSYASSGHGEALHYHKLSNELEHLPASGPPLGVIPEGAYIEEQVNLWPGDLILLYSDGIPESTDALGNFYGFPRFKYMVERHHGDELDALLQAIRADVEEQRGQAPISDDVTLMAIRVEPYELEQHFLGDLSVAETAVAWAKHYWRALPEKTSYDLELAFFELLTNIFKHGYEGKPGPIDVTMGLFPDKVTLVVRDNGKTVQQEVPEAIQTTQSLRDSGYGLGIINTIFDEFSHNTPPGGGNLWVFTKQVK